jgi:dUTP pyrophosphatase
MEEILVPLQTGNEDVLLPEYASSGSAGADVRAELDEPLTIEAGESEIIPTGLRFAIPDGYELQIRPRSGLAAKHQITVLNTPGTLDADYRGELFVILINHGKEPFTITPGMRIAQVVLASVVRALFHRCEELEETVRGEGRFGHTGTH